MLTILISTLVTAAVSAAVYFSTTSIPFNWSFTFAIGLVVFVAVNFFIGRHFIRKTTALFSSIENDVKKDNIEVAVDRMKGGYQYAKWLFFVNRQIDAQIGVMYYIKKRFDDARPYLSKGYTAVWTASAMYAALLYKEKDTEQMKKVLTKMVKKNKKVGFVYALYGYFYWELNEKDEAIKVLSRGVAKCPADAKLAAIYTSAKNNKKLKIQNYGHVWMQLHLGKQAPDGAKQYQAHLMGQRIKRR